MGEPTFFRFGVVIKPDSRSPLCLPAVLRFFFFLASWPDLDDWFFLFATSAIVAVCVCGGERRENVRRCDGSGECHVPVSMCSKLLIRLSVAVEGGAGVVWLYRSRSSCLFVVQLVVCFIC